MVRRVVAAAWASGAVAVGCSAIVGIGEIRPYDPSSDDAGGPAKADSSGAADAETDTGDPSPADAGCADAWSNTASCPPGTLFCDPFESDPPLSPWKVNQ